MCNCRGGVYFRNAILSQSLCVQYLYDLKAVPWLFVFHMWNVNDCSAITMKIFNGYLSIVIYCAFFDHAKQLVRYHVFN